MFGTAKQAEEPTKHLTSSTPEQGMVVRPDSYTALERNGVEDDGYDATTCLRFKIRSPRNTYYHSHATGLRAFSGQANCHDEFLLFFCCRFLPLIDSE